MLWDHKLVPAKLWSNNTLRLPPLLVQSYENVLRRLGLLQRASSTNPPSNLTGGASKAAAEDHFCYRFSNSSGRAEFVVLNPRGDVQRGNDSLHRALAYGSVAILDAPAGTGAGALATLSTFQALRTAHILPSPTLRVHVVSADISQHALDIGARLFDEVRPGLAATGIVLTNEELAWDATDPDSTARVGDAWAAAATRSGEALLLVTNFSGETRKEKSFAKISAQLTQLFSRAYQVPRTLIWIEPCVRKPASFVRRVLGAFWPWGDKAEYEEDDPAAECREFRLEVRPSGKEVRSEVLVFRVEHRTGSAPP